MSKVVIDDSKLVNIADAIRNKNGSANKYTPTEMATAIGDIKVSSGAELAPEDLVLTGDCSYKFSHNGWNWFIEKFGDKITTKDITNGAAMFSDNAFISSVPFSLNFKKDDTATLWNIFASSSIVFPPSINNVKVKNTHQVFNNCYFITEIPENYFDTWDFSYFNESTFGGDACGNMFYNCSRLRKIPSDLSMFYIKGNSYNISIFWGGFFNCYVLEKTTNLPVPVGVFTSNAFSSTFKFCHRLKQITFSLNNGMPKTARWQKQVIDLATCYVGYGQDSTDFTYYGMPSDTEIKDDTSYQLLKNNEDSYTKNIAYSRYNHDSAVETINTLPDTSAYLAESGGTTNIIKFTGASGSATDGGAINTLTEAEIAVAAAKGWTVTLV